MIPFSAEAYFSFLANYNPSIWPLQIVGLIAGLVICGLLVRPIPHAGRIIAAILAIAWGMTGTFYHLGHFATLNFWDYGVGALFLIQSVLFTIFGIALNRLAIEDFLPGRQKIAMAIAFVATVIYPLISPMLLGRGFNQTAIFGVAPTPVILMTLGILLLHPIKGHRVLWIIPVLAALAGTGLAIALPIPEDWLLMPALFIALSAAFFLRAKPRP